MLSPTREQCLWFVTLPRVYGWSPSSPWWWASSSVQTSFTQAQWIVNQMNTKRKSHTKHRSAHAHCSLGQTDKDWVRYRRRWPELSKTFEKRVIWNPGRRACTESPYPSTSNVPLPMTLLSNDKWIPTKWQWTKTKETKYGNCYTCFVVQYSLASLAITAFVRLRLVLIGGSQLKNPLKVETFFSENLDSQVENS